MRVSRFEHFLPRALIHHCWLAGSVPSRQHLAGACSMEHAHSEPRLGTPCVCGLHIGEKVDAGPSPAGTDGSDRIRWGGGTNGGRVGLFTQTYSTCTARYLVSYRHVGVHMESHEETRFWTGRGDNAPATTEWQTTSLDDTVPAYVLIIGITYRFGTVSWGVTVLPAKAVVLLEGEVIVGRASRWA